jgi:hypothetical protein
VPFSRLRGSGFRIEGLQPHPSYQAPNPLVIDCITLSLQIVSHPTPAIEGPLHVLGVDETHQMEVELRFRCRFIVQGGAIEPHQFTLTADAEVGMIRLNQLTFGATRTGQLIFQPFQFHLQPANLFVELVFLDRLFWLRLAVERVSIPLGKWTLNEFPGSSRSKSGPASLWAASLRIDKRCNIHYCYNICFVRS